MPSLLEILNDPDYTGANFATKQAIFDKYSVQDPDFTTANGATQTAIRQRFGVAAASPVAEEESFSSRLAKEPGYLKSAAERGLGTVEQAAIGLKMAEAAGRLESYAQTSPERIAALSPEERAERQAKIDYARTKYGELAQETSKISKRGQELLQTTARPATQLMMGVGQSTYSERCLKHVQGSFSERGVPCVA